MSEEAVVVEPQPHWLYNYIPRHRNEIRWYQMGKWATWALFGNDDDGIFGEEITAGNWCDKKISVKRAAKWAMRNPLHNFNFYVIGSAYKSNSEFAILSLSAERAQLFHYEKEGKTVFAGKGTGLWIGFHGWKPFVSLRINYGRVFEMYVGWRERGNFGLKFCLARKQKKEAS
ncbi:MAG: hypothetical protein JHC93_00980 [Parachlamydiales bacterium]|nr:hypothetical protein [Parachlamydiales bacterium]